MTVEMKSRLAARKALVTAARGSDESFPGSRPWLAARKLEAFDAANPDVLAALSEMIAEAR